MTKNAAVFIRMTDDDRARLEAEAKRRRLSLAGLVRSLTFTALEQQQRLEVQHEH